jgi:outer membrane lipoprotein-sorting protein
MAHCRETAARPCLHSTYPLFRVGRLLRLTLFVASVALFSAFQPAQAQDGRAILLKTMHFYQSLQSYAGRANVDTLMYGQNGQTIKHIGSATYMKMQRPNKIYIFLQNPNGSRTIYGDGTNFSVYEGTPNQYLTLPMNDKRKSLLQWLQVNAQVVAGFDALFFLLKPNLPGDLTNIKLKGTSNYNGHAVYIVTGTLNNAPTAVKGNSGGQASYWTWWIDRNSSLLYKVESTTPNVVKPVSFGTGLQATVKDVKGTIVVRYTVSEIKPDANLSASDFAFTPPRSATRKLTIDEVLKKGGQ